MRIGILWTFSSWKTTLAKDLYNNILKKENYILDIDLERYIAKYLWFDFNNHTEEELKQFQQYLIDMIKITHKRYNKLITDNPLDLQPAYKRDYKVEEDLYDILFITDIQDVELENDWVRHQDEELRKEIDKFLKEKLSNKAHLISGNRQERLDKAKRIIEEYKNWTLDTERWVKKYQKSFDF